MIEVILCLSPLSKRISPMQTQRLSAWKKIVGHLVHPFVVRVFDPVRGDGHQGRASSARFPANSEDVLEGREAPSHVEGQETHRLTGLLLRHEGDNGNKQMFIGRCLNDCGIWLLHLSYSLFLNYNLHAFFAFLWGYERPRVHPHDIAVQVGESGYEVPGISGHREKL